MIRAASSLRTLGFNWLAIALLAAGCGSVDPEVELAAAIENLAAGRYNETAIRLSNVVQAQPENAEARRLRGELALLLGDYSAAADEFDRARELGAPAESLALGLADAWTAAGQAERALELLASVEAAFAGNTAYWTGRAEALLGVGRPDEAEAALDAGGRVGDGGTRAAIARARIAFTRNDLSTAQAQLDAALDADPGEPRALLARAELFARTERFAEAAADFQEAADAYRAMSLQPREVATLLVLMQVHLARNDLDGAEKTAARLTERAPGTLLTDYFRGLVAYRRGQLDEAAALIQPLVSAAPETVQFRALLGAIHLARGNFGQAEQQFLMVLAASPRDPAAVKLLAETHLRQQRPEAALAALRAVEEAATEDPQIGLLSGLASLLSGNTEQGLLYLEQAASLDPTNELLKLQLARAYLAAGRDVEASSLLGDAFGAGSAPLEAGLLRLFADLRGGENDAGTASANELLREYPQDPRALTAVAIYFQMLGELPRARELFERAAALETDSAMARLFVAAALVQEGRTGDAELLLRAIVEADPRNTQALTALAELLIGRNSLAEAADLLRVAAEHSESNAPRLALIELLMVQGDLTAAREQLDGIAATAPDDPAVLALRGLLALAEGHSEDAAVLLRRAQAELPDRLGVSLALARAELARGQPRAARDDILRVLERAPSSLALRFALGEAELALGNAPEALSIAAALKAEYPTQAAGYLLEGEAQLVARRFTAAADAFTSAFQYRPTWSVLTRLVEVMQLAERPEEALQWTEEWVAENPAHVPGALMLAGLLQDAGRPPDALRAYERVLTIDRTNLIALNNAAWLAHELGRADALVLAERAFDVGADNAAVLDTFGWILLGQNREQEAIVHLSRAAQLAPDSPEIRYHLAEALVAGGRSSEARSMLVSLLERGIEFDQRAAAQRLLESL